MPSMIRVGRLDQFDRAGHQRGGGHRAAHRGAHALRARTADVHAVLVVVEDREGLGEGQSGAWWCWRRCRWRARRWRRRSPTTPTTTDHLRQQGAGSPHVGHHVDVPLAVICTPRRSRRTTAYRYRRGDVEVVRPYLLIACSMIVSMPTGVATSAPTANPPMMATAAALSRFRSATTTPSAPRSTATSTERGRQGPGRRP